MKEKVMQGKPYAGNPHVRFDEGAGASRHSGRSALLYTYTCILTAIAGTTSFAAAGAANADVFTLKGPVKTNAFRQAEFKWAVHLRHDYSKTYVTKLFLAMAEYDREYRGKLKNRDNGKQKVHHASG